MSQYAGSAMIRPVFLILGCSCLLLLNVGCQESGPLIDAATAGNGVAELVVLDSASQTIKHSDVPFSELAHTKGKTVIVDFWATWCGPCRQLAPEIEDVVKELGDEVVVLKVNVDTQPDLAAHFDVTAIPDVRFFRDGKAIGGFRGFKSASKIIARLKSLNP